jgi:outer membrane lipoprotein-sorting protein
VQILVVGKQGDFDKPLADLGPVNVIDIAIPVPAGDKAPEATPETLAKGRELFGQAVAALGDPQKIKAIRNVSSKFDLVQSTPMGEMKMEAETVCVYPDKVWFSLNTPGGKMNMVINGQKAVVKMPQGAMPLPEAQRKSIMESIWRDTVYVWQNAERYKFQALGRKKFADKEAIDLLVSGPELSFHLFLDPQSLLPAGTSYATVTGEGPATVEEIVTDYRDVGGVKVPFKTTAFASQKKTSEQTATAIEFNAAVGDDLFKID